MTSTFFVTDLLDVLPFSEKNSGLKAWLDETFDDVKDRDLIKNMLSNPEEVAAIAKRMAAEKRRSQKKQKASEQILSLDVERQEPISITNTDEFISISAAVLKRRKDKLIQAMINPPILKGGRERYIHLTAAKSNQQEKTFLMKNNTLIVKNLWYEEGIRQTKKLGRAILQSSRKLAKFNDCTQVLTNTNMLML